MKYKSKSVQSNTELKKEKKKIDQKGNKGD